MSLLEDKPQQLWELLQLREIVMIKVKKNLLVLSIVMHVVDIFYVFYDYAVSTHTR